MPSRVSLFVVPFNFCSGEAEAESFTAFKPGSRRKAEKLLGDTFQANSGSRFQELANVEEEDRGLVESYGQTEEGGGGMIMELARREHSGAMI